MRPRPAIAALSLVVVVLGGDLVFERVGAHAVVDAPNRGRPPLPRAPGDLAFDVGPPAARLAVAVVSPKLPPRATIFVLHGIRDNKENVRHFADHLSEAGYRAVLVDGRGQGRSSGDWLTYGVQESRDLSQLVDALHVDGPVGVMGISYGGAVAIEWAARDPRVKAAVAVAPFASLRDIVPVYTPRTVPLIGWLVPRFIIMRTVDVAGRLAGFAPDEASPRAAVRQSRTPILIVHGKNDVTVPFYQSTLIADGARDHVSLVPLDGADHDHISGDPRLWPPVLEFLAQAYR
jgi:alpha-beta hydrolase superfamily lysophospholipase